MKGIQLNANNINKQVIIDHQNMQCSSGNSSMASGYLKLLFGLLVLFPLGFVILFLLLFTIAGAGVIGGLGSAVLTTSEFGLFNAMLDSCGTMFVVGIGSILVVLVIGLHPADETDIRPKQSYGQMDTHSTWNHCRCLSGIGRIFNSTDHNQVHRSGGGVHYRAMLVNKQELWRQYILAGVRLSVCHRLCADEDVFINKCDLAKC